MKPLRTIGVLFGLALATAWGRAEVRVSVLDQGGMASIAYLCTYGEVVRAFALDVQVDRGEILAVSNFFVGPSLPGSPGYGIFPASYRDFLVLEGGNVPQWDSPGYTPLAVTSDAPSQTLPGLGSSGITLELGAVWDPYRADAAPGPNGILCMLVLSQPAQVSISANNFRGGVVLAGGGTATSTFFSGGPVGPLIVSATLQQDRVQIVFHGGELQTATDLNGPWAGTGNTSGRFSEPVGPGPEKFYRVSTGQRHP